MKQKLTKKQLAEKLDALPLNFAFTLPGLCNYKNYKRIELIDMLNTFSKYNK